MMNLLRRGLVLLFLILSVFPVRAEETLTLGVFAYRPKAIMTQRFQPLVDYLTTVLVDTRVELRVLDQTEMEDALLQSKLDLVLTNPSHYLVLRSRNSLSGVLATMNSLEGGAAVSSLGGTVIARQERQDIAHLDDLTGRRIAIPGRKYLGGYQAQAYELLQRGIQLPRDAQLIDFGTHDKVVEAILAGDADAGFIRTGVLEQLKAEGRTDIDALKVLNIQNLPGFPFRASTRLYPEWPFVALPQVRDDQVRRIASSLLALEPDHPVAQAAGIAGFVPPADYLAIEQLARALRLPPYEHSPPLTWGDVWQQYRPWLLALGFLLALLVLAALALVRQNRRIQADARRMRHLIDTWPEPMLLIADERFMEANPAALALLGLADRSDLLGRGATEISPLRQADGRLSSDRIKEIFADVAMGKAQRFEWQHRRPDGSLFHVDVSLVPVHHEGRQIYLCAWHDITERIQAEAKLKLSASVFSHAREGIMITDADSRIIDVNDTFIRITGYGREEVVGQRPNLLRSGHQSPEFYAAMWRDLLAEGHWYGEIWNRRKNGEEYAEMLTISAVRDSAGQIQNYVALFVDITQLKEQQRQLEHIAHYDALTNLPNRVLFSDRLHQAMSQSIRRGRSLAVAYLDLDGFKAINDQHGHSIGDTLLVSIAQRMKTALRDGDTLARIGGDEFVAVLIDLDDLTDCTPVLQRLLDAASSPILVGQQALSVSASIGVTLYPRDSADADQLLRHADQAMYLAKQAGKNRYHLFDVQGDAAVKTHKESLEHIRRAIEQDELVLYYQPKVNMSTGEVVGAEALIRWLHPERGLLPPGDFLPIIEDHPLAFDLGEWVLDHAIAQVAAWQAAGLAIPVSINIGALHLLHSDFLAGLERRLAAHPDIPPGLIELEVLETSALEDIAEVSRIMHACRDIGVSFALDDFGTGYSSLTYLKRLPAEFLKIDQSFVRDMLDDPEDLAILDGVLGLASAFRRQVVAEGVETTRHGVMLLQLGCELAQGYGIARPMPAEHLPGWIAEWRPDPDWAPVVPVGRERLPFLYAGVEHRSWLRAVEDHLNGVRERPFELDARRCRFGHWLAHEIAGPHGSDDRYRKIDDLHESVHLTAAKLLDLQAPAHNAEARARLVELHDLSAALLTELHVLIGLGQ